MKTSYNTLYLIDISSFIFRAFYAVRELTSPEGTPVNAVYGVATMLQRLMDEADPKFLAVVYDSKEPSFRKIQYPEYKANRSAPPEMLLPQFDIIEELVNQMGIPSFRQSGVEADDLIALGPENGRVGGHHAHGLLAQFRHFIGARHDLDGPGFQMLEGEGRRRPAPKAVEGGSPSNVHAPPRERLPRVSLQPFPRIRRTQAPKGGSSLRICRNPLAKGVAPLLIAPRGGRLDFQP
jgi:hypothetical protein